MPPPIDVDDIYPVGSVYMSTSSTSPASLFGGTWSQYSQGRTLVGVNASDGDFSTVKAGGSKDHQHAITFVAGDYWGSSKSSPNTVSGSPASYADIGIAKYDSSGPIVDRTKFDWKIIGSGSGWTFSNHPKSISYITFDRYQNTGSTAYTSSLPPYQTVYMFRRTA